jgi:hypothetical protein
VVSVFNATILANAPAAKGFLAVARLLRNQTLPNLHVARQILVWLVMTCNQTRPFSLARCAV